MESVRQKRILEDVPEDAEAGVLGSSQCATVATSVHQSDFICLVHTGWEPGAAFAAGGLQIPLDTNQQVRPPGSQLRCAGASEEGAGVHHP